MLKALKLTITRKDQIPELKESKVPKGILMNATRKRILQYLSRYPCIHLHRISRELGLSLNNARWHLAKLVENGYLTTVKLGNKRIFYPSGLIGTEDIEILALVNNKNTSRIFPIIASTPGITQQEISGLINIKQQTLIGQINLFEDKGLIIAVRDGQYKRYYPTNTIKTCEELNHGRYKEFRQIILKILVRDGVNPNIIRTTDKNIHIQITTGKSRSNLILYLNPFDRFLNISKNKNILDKIKITPNLEKMQ